jgi:hypothetical protein
MMKSYTLLTSTDGIPRCLEAHLTMKAPAECLNVGVAPPDNSLPLWTSTKLKHPMIIEKGKEGEGWKLKGVRIRSRPN